MDVNYLLEFFLFTLQKKWLKIYTNFIRALEALKYHPVYIIPASQSVEAL